MRCAKYDAVPQRDPAKTEAHQRAADAVASSASGRLAGAGRVRRLLVRHSVARPWARRLSHRSVRVGQPVLPARRVARGCAAHRPCGPAAPGRGGARRPFVEDRAGIGQEQARARHRERQVPPV